MASSSKRSALCKAKGLSHTVENRLEQPFFVIYKETVKGDADSKLINGFWVTAANMEDNCSFLDLLDEKDRLLNNILWS